MSFYSKSGVLLKLHVYTGVQSLIMNTVDWNHFIMVIKLIFTGMCNLLFSAEEVDEDLFMTSAKW